MTGTKTTEKPAEPVSVTVSLEPSQQDRGVFVMSVKIDNEAAGVSVVRTSPKDFAFQRLAAER